MLNNWRGLVVVFVVSALALVSEGQECTPVKVYVVQQHGAAFPAISWRPGLLQFSEHYQSEQYEWGKLLPSAVAELFAQGVRMGTEYVSKGMLTEASTITVQAIEKVHIEDSASAVVSGMVEAVGGAPVDTVDAVTSPVSMCPAYQSRVVHTSSLEAKTEELQALLSGKSEWDLSLEEVYLAATALGEAVEADQELGEIPLGNWSAKEIQMVKELRDRSWNLQWQDPKYNTLFSQPLVDDIINFFSNNRSGPVRVHTGEDQDVGPFAAMLGFIDEDADLLRLPYGATIELELQECANGTKQVVTSLNGTQGRCSEAPFCTWKEFVDLVQPPGVDFEEDCIVPDTDPETPSPAREGFVSFPKYWSWGITTSAFQVEGNQGGRGESIWDAFALESGKIADGTNASVGADSYSNWKQDIQLVKDLGVDEFSMSISWARVMPDGLNVNQDGMKYYRDIINDLKKAGIKPVVTLYDWDMPQKFHELYSGWRSEKVAEEFLYYCKIVMQTFGDAVTKWITFHDPRSISMKGYGSGVQAPGEIGRNDPYTVGHNILLTHLKLVEYFRKSIYPIYGGTIGIALNADWMEPNNSSLPEDAEAADRANSFVIGWFMSALTTGDYPEQMRDSLGARLPSFTSHQSRAIQQSVDFIGISHYTTQTVTALPNDVEVTGWYLDAGVMPSDPIGRPTDSPSRPSVPFGMRKAVTYAAEKYCTEAEIPMVVTSCGAPYLSNASPPQALNDSVRIQWMQDYLEELKEAVYGGADVRGFYVRSLLDGFEWEAGYTERWGLAYVDFKTLKRYKKASFQWYRSQILFEHDVDPFTVEPVPEPPPKTSQQPPPIPSGAQRTAASFISLFSVLHWLCSVVL